MGRVRLCDSATRACNSQRDGSRSFRESCSPVLHVDILVNEALVRYKLYRVSEMLNCLVSLEFRNILWWFLEIIVHSVKIVSRAPAGLLFMIALQHARAVPFQLFGATKAGRAEEAVLVRVP